jgi:hypothetical protein
MEHEHPSHGDRSSKNDAFSKGNNSKLCRHHPPQFSPAATQTHAKVRICQLLLDQNDASELILQNVFSLRVL